MKNETRKDLNNQGAVILSRTHISYKPLWKLLIDKELSKTELRTMTGIAPSTMVKMGHNEYVALDVIVRICVALNCSMNDVIEIAVTDSDQI